MIAQEKDGKYKLIGNYPETYKSSEGDISPFHLQSQEVLKSYGFYPYERPIPAQGEKLGELYLNEQGLVTNYLVPKSPEELAGEAETKKQMEAEKIKEAKIKAYVESVLTPTERLAYYPEWKAGAYKNKERVTFKGKTFENTIEGNTNAPDKGGWIEIK